MIAVPSLNRWLPPGANARARDNGGSRSLHLFLKFASRFQPTSKIWGAHVERQVS